MAYRSISNPVHHAQARVGSANGARDPLQLVEHSGDAAGVVPAIAHILGRTTLHHLRVLPVVMCVWGGSHMAEAYSSLSMLEDTTMLFTLLLY